MRFEELGPAYDNPCGSSIEKRERLAVAIREQGYNVEEEGDLAIDREIRDMNGSTIGYINMNRITVDTRTDEGKRLALYILQLDLPDSPIE